MFTDEIHQIVEDLVEVLGELGVNIIGRCYDGDPRQRTFYTVPFYDAISAEVDPTKKGPVQIVQILGRYKDLLAIPDPLHILKRIRTRLINKVSVVDPTVADSRGETMLSLP